MNALRPWALSLSKSASMGFCMSLTGCSNVLALEPRHLVAVLVAAAGEADDHHVLGAPFGRQTHALDHGVGRLQGGQDALQARAQPEGLQGLVVVDAGVADAAAVLPEAVLGPDARVVEPGRHRVDRGGLA